MYRRSPLRSTLRIVCSTGLPTCLPIYSTGVLFGMMPCLTDWLGSAGSFYLKPPTGNLGTRTAIRTTVRPQLAHGRDSQSRPNLSYRRLEVLAKFRPLAARGSAQLLNLVYLYPLIGVSSVPGSVHSIFTYDSAGSREREFRSEIRHQISDSKISLPAAIHFSRE